MEERLCEEEKQTLEINCQHSLGEEEPFDGFHTLHANCSLTPFSINESSGKNDFGSEFHRVVKKPKVHKEIHQFSPTKPSPKKPSPVYRSHNSSICEMTGVVIDDIPPLDLNLQDDRLKEKSGNDESNTEIEGENNLFSEDEYSDGEEEEFDLTESTYMDWLVQQKESGTKPEEILDALGLAFSKEEGEAIDDIAAREEELWNAIFSMGFQLLRGPRVPTRKKLYDINTLDDAISLLQQKNNILVLTGAGISVSCGIPDFRSENGIYSRLAEYNLPNPQCMFDIDFFRSNPRPFFTFANELFPKSDGFSYVPSRSHYFLRLLEEKQKLLRVYSQNIDMLEAAAGISEEKSILCHGSFATATCLACKRCLPGEALRKDIAQKTVPMCDKCKSANGILKPDIVFFGESLPKRFHDLIEVDQLEADLVLVMGSSLKVEPVRSIIGRFPPEVPLILMNRETVGQPHKFDIELLGYCDNIVEIICKRLEWTIPSPPDDLVERSRERALVTESDPVSTCDILQSETGDAEKESYIFCPPSRYMFRGSKIDFSSTAARIKDAETSTISDENLKNSQLSEPSQMDVEIDQSK